MRVLIVTLPGDQHAHAVHWALGELGHTCNFFYPLDLSDRALWTFDPGRSEIRTSFREQAAAFCFRDFDTIWLRRVPLIVPLPHIDDLKERAGAESEMELLVSGTITAFEHDAFTVNSLAATIAASNKPRQLMAAARAGFVIPRTIVSNDPEEIRSFWTSLNGRMIFKPLKTVMWTRADGSRTTAPTTDLRNLDCLADIDFSISPGIFQENIARRAEVRVTLMGETAFAWSKSPHVGSVSSNVDWRLTGMNESVHERYYLPSHVSKCCKVLMRELGLLFGTIDLAVTPDGGYVFFEVNPGGQFLWGDTLGLGITQLDAFARFLVEGRSDFVYESGPLPLTYAQFEQAKALGDPMANEIASHVGDLARFHYGRASVEM